MHDEASHINTIFGILINNLVNNLFLFLNENKQEAYWALKRSHEYNVIVINLTFNVLLFIYNLQTISAFIFKFICLNLNMFY